MWGMTEQKSLYFTIGDTSADQNDAADVQLDLAAALTAVNRKQYHQCEKDGTPLAYHFTIKALKTDSSIGVCAAPNTWTTRNAAKKTAIGWKAQMKNAGIRLSELPTYARRFRCAFDRFAVASGANQQTLTNHLVPDGCDGNRLFTAYDAPDGTSITYATSNEVVLLPIGEGATDDYKAVLCNATTGDMFGMIHEYLKSRRNMREETDMTTEFPDSDGLMNTLFAVSEELADDVVGAVDDYNIARPYSESDAALPVHVATVTAGITNFQETGVAPLGLLKFSGLAVDDIFQIDVHAITEM